MRPWGRLSIYRKPPHTPLPRAIPIVDVEKETSLFLELFSNKMIRMWLNIFISSQTKIPIFIFVIRFSPKNSYYLTKSKAKRYKKFKHGLKQINKNNTKETMRENDKRNNKNKKK